MTSPGWNQVGLGVGEGMQNFGAILVKARLQDMQLKAEAASQLAQIQAQIQGQMGLEGFRQSFREKTEMPHELKMQTERLKEEQKFRKEVEMPYERETERLKHGFKLDEMGFGFRGQAWLEGIRHEYDLDKQEFASRDELFRMARAHGYRVEELEAQAKNEGKILDKKYLLEKKMKEHFLGPEHQNALALIEARGKQELAQMQGANESQLQMVALKSAMEAAPEPMLDYILAKQHGLRRDPKTGEMTGDIKQMATYMQAREIAKRNRLGARVQAIAKTMSVKDPEGAKRMVEFATALTKADIESMPGVIKQFEAGLGGAGGAGAGGMSLEEFFDQIRGTASRPGAESRGAESRPDIGEFVPEEMPEPEPEADPEAGLGERGRNVLRGVLNELGGKTTEGGQPLLEGPLVEKPEGDRFYRLTGTRESSGAALTGGLRVLRELNAKKTDEKFLFDPQRGGFREAPPKEAIANKEAVEQVWGPEVAKKYGERAVNEFQRYAWDAIKEASLSEIGVGKTIQEVRKKHPELEVQEDSMMTEELKVALLRLRAADKAAANEGGPFLSTVDFTSGRKGLANLIGDINRLVQEAKLGKGEKVRAPKTAIGRGK